MIKPPKPGLGFGFWVLGFGILGFGLAWLGCGKKPTKNKTKIIRFLLKLLRTKWTLYKKNSGNIYLREVHKNKIVKVARNPKRFYASFIIFPRVFTNKSHSQPLTLTLRIFWWTIFTISARKKADLTEFFLFFCFFTCCQLLIFFALNISLERMFWIVSVKSGCKSATVTALSAQKVVLSLLQVHQAEGI